MKHAFLISVLAGCLAAPVAAQTFSDVARAELDVGWRDTDGSHVAGLTISLAPGWKTYWRAPGDGGIPPSFNWSGSENIVSVDVHYPVPEVFDQNGIQSIGYSEAVTFPLRIATKDSAAAIGLQGEIEIGVCEEVCIPVTLNVRAQLPSGGSPSPALRSVLADRPERGGQMTCAIEPISDGLRMVVETAVARHDGGNVVIIEVSEEGVWVSRAEVEHADGRLSAEVEMVPPTAKPFALARSDVRMTILSADRAIETVGCD